jgi:hypothetical protein
MSGPHVDIEIEEGRWMLKIFLLVTAAAIRALLSQENWPLELFQQSTTSLRFPLQPDR